MLVVLKHIIFASNKFFGLVDIDKTWLKGNTMEGRKGEALSAIISISMRLLCTASV
jgi:hypothetical protein